MPNLRKERSGRPARPKKEQKCVLLWLDIDKWEQIRQAADSIQEPITGWIRRAVYQSLRKWELPVAKELFDKCSICGKRHNREEHFSQ